MLAGADRLEDVTLEALWGEFRAAMLGGRRADRELLNDHHATYCAGAAAVLLVIKRLEREPEETQRRILGRLREEMHATALRISPVAGDPRGN